MVKFKEMCGDVIKLEQMDIILYIDKSRLIEIANAVQSRRYGLIAKFKALFERRAH